MEFQGDEVVDALMRSTLIFFWLGVESVWNEVVASLDS